MYIRVASAIARAEETEELQKKWAAEYYSMMARNEFMPNSPTLMNAGRRLGMLSACFVLPVEDDLDEIFNSVKATAMVQRAGGGTGFNFSNLRPSGSIVRSSGGTTAGPLSFINVFSQTTNTIQQGAFRRGANMGIMNIDHPDIVGFIKEKSNLKQWQNYNVSIAITDEWIAELEIHPLNQHKVKHPAWGEGVLFKGPNGVFAYKIPGPVDGVDPALAGCRPWTNQDTWDLICERAHATGEPGLFFIDEANKNNPVPHLGRITATNPCFHPDTLIETVEGQKKIKDITSPVKVYSMDQNKRLCIRQASAAWLSKKNQKTKTITMGNGDSITVTYDHKLFVLGKGWIEAQNIELRDHVVSLCRSRRGAAYSGVKLSSEDNRAYQMEHRLVAEAVYGSISNDDDVHHIDGNSYNNHYSNLAILEHATHARLTSYEQPNDHQITNDIGRFITHAGSKHGAKTIVPMPRHLATNHSNTPRVVKIEEGPVTDVYDISVEETNCLVANRLVSHNCGEQPLHPFDSCNLGSINLTKVVEYNYAGDPIGLDVKKFKLLVEKAVRYLDSVIEVNNYPIPQIKEMSRKTRRIGLGVMGWADLLYMLGITYNSEAAYKYAETVSVMLHTYATHASMELAKEKGNYGAYEGSLDEQLGRPMRNAYRTTVAPTGTISIIANCSGGIEPLFALAFKRTVMPDANSVFKEMYEENEHWVAAVEKCSMFASEAKDMRAYAKEHGSLHGYRDDGNADVVNLLKRVFVTSHDIDPIDHVKMQAAWQKGIDTSISKTVNLPHDAPVSVVSEVYWEAYFSGCKGITVYRDGCRNNVEGMKQPMSVEKFDKRDKAHGKLVEFKDLPSCLQEALIEEPKLDKKVMFPYDIVQNAEEARENHTRARPDVLPAYRTQVQTQFGNLHVVIVIDPETEREIEIFAQLGKGGDLPAADLEAIGRLASLALKSGLPLEKVIEQLEGIGTTHVMPTAEGKISSMPDALAKALKKYLSFRKGQVASKPKKKDRIDTDYGVKCPSCSTGRLIFQEGCKKCPSCSFSAC